MHFLNLLLNFKKVLFFALTKYKSGNISYTIFLFEFVFIYVVFTGDEWFTYTSEQPTIFWLLPGGF